MDDDSRAAEAEQNDGMLENVTSTSEYSELSGSDYGEEVKKVDHGARPPLVKYVCAGNHGYAVQKNRCDTTW